MILRLWRITTAPGADFELPHVFPLVSDDALLRRFFGNSDMGFPVSRHSQETRNDKDQVVGDPTFVPTQQDTGLIRRPLISLGLWLFGGSQFLSFSPIFVKATYWYLGLDLVVEQNQRRTFELALNKDECNFFQAGNLVLFHTLHSHFPHESFRKLPDCRKCRSCPIFLRAIANLRSMHQHSQWKQKRRSGVMWHSLGLRTLIRETTTSFERGWLQVPTYLSVTTLSWKLQAIGLVETVTAIPRHSCYWHETSWAACVGLSLSPRQCEKHGCNPWRIWLTLTDLIVYRWPFWRSLKCLDLRDPLLSACFYDNWHLSTLSWAPSPRTPLGSSTAPEGRILRVPKSIPGGSGAPCSWYQQSLHAKCTIPKASSSVEISPGHERPWTFPKIKSYEFYGYGMICSFF